MMMMTREVAVVVVKGFAAHEVSKVGGCSSVVGKGVAGVGSVGSPVASASIKDDDVGCLTGAEVREKECEGADVGVFVAKTGDAPGAITGDDIVGTIGVASGDTVFSIELTDGEVGMDGKVQEFSPT